MAVANARAQSPSEPAAAEQETSKPIAVAFAAAVTLLTTCIFAFTAWRARRDPCDLAFVFIAYADLTALLLCLRRAKTLTPASPAAERRRLHAAVWALSAALCCAFAYRVSLLMPAALVVVVWCMTSFVVGFGFFLLVLCNDCQRDYQTSVDDVDCDAAGDVNKPLVKQIRPTDEIV